MDKFFLDRGQEYIDKIEMEILTFEFGKTSLSKAKEKLGLPYSEFESTTPKGSNMKVTGACITYYVRKLEENSVNLKYDKEYTFCFDLEGKLVEFWRSNI